MFQTMSQTTGERGAHRGPCRAARGILITAIALSAGTLASETAQAEYMIRWNAPEPTLLEGYLQHGMIGDFDGDGQLEIVGDEQGTLFVRNAMTGQAEAEFAMSPNVIELGLADLDFDGTPEVVGDGGYFRFVLDFDASSSTPFDQTMMLHQLVGAAPNPFAPQTTIAFALGANGEASLDIHDVNGRRVRQLFSEQMEAGLHRVVWDGHDDNGHQMASGTYFYRLRYEKKVVGTERVVILR